ncbi:MAG: hypothetical protein VX663_09345 [Pseudomonadota bacterium]|nr:hypothetical protein [Pseudomonadota bacterium]
MNQLKLGLAALFCSVVVPAQAAVVLPGSLGNLVGTTVAAEPDLAGLVVNDNPIRFDFPATALTDALGAVQNRVVESGNLGTLIFAPRIAVTANTGVGDFQILGFSVDGYAGWETNIEFRTDGLGDVGPDYVFRSPDGDTLTFLYDSSNPINLPGGIVGENSLFPSILTNATSFSLTGLMTLFGIDTANPSEIIAVRVSGVAVPEIPIPATALLFGSGALLVGWVSGRRKIA